MPLVLVGIGVFLLVLAASAVIMITRVGRENTTLSVTISIL